MDCLVREKNRATLGTSSLESQALSLLSGAVVSPSRRSPKSYKFSPQMDDAPLKAVPVAARPGTRLITPSLRQCQIDTPDQIVRFTWEQVFRRRRKVKTVLDLGAGKGNFAAHGRYDSYVGYEIDAKRVLTFATTRYRVIHGDALDAAGTFDLVIGNPPYIRNQDLKGAWRQRAVSLIEAATEVEVDLRANLYIYFMWLALLRSKSNGLVAQIVPADWLVRPSADRLRRYIKSKSWKVEAHVFDDADHFFPAVNTNLTLTIIDKSRSAEWTHFAVRNDLSLLSSKQRPELVDALTPFPTLRRRSSGLRAGRGLSPGAQQTFVLTEPQRREHRIELTSVVPCITSLRGLPRSLTSLTEAAFKTYYVNAGRRCWLLKTDKPTLSTAVLTWLRQTPKSVRTNSTCRGRAPWYKFLSPPVADILYSSGFRATGPMFLVNAVQARAVGAVHGIFGADRPGDLSARLRLVNYERSRFRHGGEFLKIEISQMNELLDETSRALDTAQKASS